MSTELLPIESVNAVDLFTGQKMDDLLNKIATHVRSQAVNATTDKGRAEIKSLARKVASSKVAIDNAGKDLVADLKKQTSTIDATRKKARDFLDRLRDEVRQPVTEWEEAEERRADTVAKFFDKIRDHRTIEHGEDSDAIQIRINRLAEMIVDPEVFLDRSEEAENTLAAAKEHLTQAHSAAEKAEADARELQRLREQEEARLKAEREAAEKAEQERLAKEAAERAEAEAKRREEEAAERARAEEKRLAEEAIAKAEREKQEAIQNAEAERQALIREQERKEAEHKAALDHEAAEQAKREANKKHRAKIISQTRNTLQTFGIGETAARDIADAISEGKIPNVKMEF